MRKRKNIVLIGMTGCGKSTVGRALSYKLKMPFIDMDKYIEHRAGKTIPQIFAESGEEAFRALETKAARDLSQERGTIISTGGGVVLRPENMAFLKKRGIVVYIDRPVPNILETLRVDTRPMLKGKKDTLFAMYESRNPLYLEYADIHIVNDADFRSGVENVYRAVKQRIERGRRQRDRSRQHPKSR